MPIAGGSIIAGAEFHYQDHDTDEINPAPVVQNNWYELFEAADVRLLWCSVIQTNDETDNMDVEARWTIDGTEYLWASSLASGTTAFVFRGPVPSTGGTLGLMAEIAGIIGADTQDKRGHVFKVEMRITSVPGTNQTLLGRCVRETQTQT